MKMIKQPAKKDVKYSVGDKVIVEEYRFAVGTETYYTTVTITKMNRITMQVEDENGYGFLFDPREAKIVTEEDIAKKAMKRHAR